MKDLKKLKKHELIDIVNRTQHFLWGFELLFDGEWDLTQSIIQNDEGGLFIEKDWGTFNNPLVKDESNNWANRGSLLYNYRELKKILCEKLEIEEEILF